MKHKSVKYVIVYDKDYSTTVVLLRPGRDWKPAIGAPVPIEEVQNASKCDEAWVGKPVICILGEGGSNFCAMIFKLMEAMSWTLGGDPSFDGFIWECFHEFLDDVFRQK